MRTKGLLVIVAASLGLVTLLTTTEIVSAQAAAALTGVVSSKEEGKMEGVVVSARKDGGMIKLLVRAHEVRKVFDADSLSLAGLAAKCSYNVDYCTVLLKLSYLAPDITASILDGRHPEELTRQRLARIRRLPFDWEEQRELLGFATAQTKLPE